MTEEEESSNAASHTLAVKHSDHKCDSCTKSIVGVCYHSINIPDYDLCHNCRAEYRGEDIQFEAVLCSDPSIASASALQDTIPLPSSHSVHLPDKKRVESSSTANRSRACANSTHLRHRCDACLTKPIVGLRYHAVNLPNYDLCADCRAEYNGEDICFESTFQPSTKGCNSCHEFPLVGMYYHAIILRDYNLCTTCKEAIKEVVFGLIP